MAAPSIGRGRAGPAVRSGTMAARGGTIVDMDMTDDDASIGGPGMDTAWDATLKEDTTFPLDPWTKEDDVGARMLANMLGGTVFMTIPPGRTGPLAMFTGVLGVAPWGPLVIMSTTGALRTGLAVVGAAGVVITGTTLLRRFADRFDGDAFPAPPVTLLPARCV